MSLHVSGYKESRNSGKFIGLVTSEYPATLLGDIDQIVIQIFPSPAYGLKSRTYEMSRSYMERIASVSDLLLKQCKKSTKWHVCSKLQHHITILKKYRVINNRKNV